jgi:hypothetical protein
MLAPFNVTTAFAAPRDRRAEAARSPHSYTFIKCMISGLMLTF